MLFGESLNRCDSHEMFLEKNGSNHFLWSLILMLRYQSGCSREALYNLAADHRLVPKRLL